MSTSKIGRGIKTRDVVTPGFSDRKTNKSNEMQKELNGLVELYNDLESLYKEQEDKLNNVLIKMSKLDAQNTSKQVVIQRLEEELKEKNNILSNINLRLKTLESKVRLIESSFEELKKKFEDKEDPKKNKWNLFKD